MAACRSFQTSASRMSKRKPRFQNIKAEKMGLIKDEKKLEDYHKRTFPAYTEADKAVLRDAYSPEQFEAIMAGEEAIDPKDLTIQGRLRDDPYRFDYLEDFATIQPIIDKKPKVNVAPPADYDFPDVPKWTDMFMDKLADHADTKMQDTIGKAVARALRRAKRTNPDMIDYSEDELAEMEANPELRRKLIIEGEKTHAEAFENIEKEWKAKPANSVGQTAEWWDSIDKHFFDELQNELGLQSYSVLEPSYSEVHKQVHGDDPLTANGALAPELGKVPGVEGLYQGLDKPNGTDDEDPTFKLVRLTTGMNSVDIMRLMTKTVVIRRVAQETRLGKVIRFHAMILAGNGNGRLGIGEAKSTDLVIAVSTARLLSMRNMRPIRRYENRTVYGDIESKVSGTVVKLSARPPGFGLRVPHRIFEMARLAGIHDLAAKIPRNKNPMNSVRATYNCLTNQPDPEEIAIGRGKKLVDVRKVYYGGAVY